MKPHYPSQMSDYSKTLFTFWAEKPLSRRTLLVAAIATTFSNSSLGRAIGASKPTFNIILGRPTLNSIAMNIIASESMNVYVEYGYSKSQYTKRSSRTTIKANSPVVVELEDLKPNSKVYYRIRWISSKSNSSQVSKQYSFSTAKKAAMKFSFTIQGDTHPERAGKMFNLGLYGVTLTNILKQEPDFHILMGDDFSIDPLISKGQANLENVESIYRTHRDWLSVIGSCTPLYLVNGNHEQAAAYLLDGTTTNPAVLAGNARLKYFALPAPDNFYSGNQTEIPNIGLPRDYYAWTWGDALFVTLDPYWHSKNAVDNVSGVKVAGSSSEATKGSKKNSKSAATSENGEEVISQGGKSRNLWEIGIGDEQYFWLKKTLEESDSKFKFIFAHHVMGTGRGAVELSYDYEWGGNDPKELTSFEKERPNWELPIHDLMVKNNVSIFFQGHDHIFVTQERDGIIYQSIPNPADDTFSYFNDASYKTGTKAPNSGHLRVSVSPQSAVVEYFLAARPDDYGRRNLQLAHKYSVEPKK